MQQRFIQGTMEWFRAWSYLCLLLLMLPAMNAAEPAPGAVKLAIVGSEANGNLAALLTAGLAACPNIVMLERSELQKLASEKQMREFDGGNGLGRALKLLKADGLVVLSRTVEGGPVSLRLFSTHNGIRLWSTEIPETDPKELADRLTETLAGKTPKCLLSEESAMPVAVVNLRAAIFSLNNVQMETKLTRLLEMRLDAEPGVIVLERKELGSAQFERDLAPDPSAPLQTSVLLLEGSFEGGEKGQEIHLTLKMSGRQGKKEIVLKAAGGEMAAMMNAAASFVTGTASPAQVFGAKEAQEFLSEATWGEAHGMNEMALDAGEAAAALGETSPELRQLLARSYIKIASRERRFYGGKFLERPPTPPLVRYDAIFRALILCAGLRKENKAGPYEEVLEVGANFLRELDDAPPADLDRERLRKELREMSQFNPEGKMSPEQSTYAAKHMPELVVSKEEMVLFSKAFIQSDNPKRFLLVRKLQRTPEEALGRRFWNAEEGRAVLVAWAKMWAENPPTELLGLMLLSRHGNPEEAGQAYLRLLKELASRSPALEKSGELNEYLKTEWQNDDISRKFSKERAQFLKAEFLQLTQYYEAIDSQYFSRSQYDEADTRMIWDAFKIHRELLLKASPADKQGEMTRRLNAQAQNFLKRYPSLDQGMSAEGALVVNRYWCPAYGPDPREFYWSSLVTSGNEVWLSGSWNGRPTRSVMRVTLPNMTTRDDLFEAEGQDRGGKLAATADAIYLLHGGNPTTYRPAEFYLRRFDRHSETWAERKFQTAFEIFPVYGDLYFSLFSFSDASHESGILKYNWDTEKSELLASTRRKPPLNRMDAAEPSRIKAIFEAPEKKVWVAAGNPLERVYLVQKKDENWDELLKMKTLYAAIHENTALLTEYDGQAIYVTPEESQIWLKPGTTGKFGWKKPAGWKRRWLDEGTVAFRPDEMFVISQRDDLVYEILWYWKGGPSEGLAIPLNFQLPEAAREGIEAIAKKGRGLNFKADDVAKPERFPASYLIPFATGQGLILKTLAHGFWFIPNADLEARKAAAGKAE